jgi:hypothetical protein
MYLSLLTPNLVIVTRMGMEFVRMRKKQSIILPWHLEREMLRR